MFGKMTNFMDQMQLIQKLMKDDNFKVFISHPKIQAVFSDPSFQAVLKTKDQTKITNHPKLLALQSDPDVAALLSKIDFKKLMG